MLGPGGALYCGQLFMMTWRGDVAHGIARARGARSVGLWWMGKSVQCASCVRMLGESF